jgi:hypothetical protein
MPTKGGGVFLSGTALAAMALKEYMERNQLAGKLRAYRWGFWRGERQSGGWETRKIDVQRERENAEASRCVCAGRFVGALGLRICERVRRRNECAAAALSRGAI